MQVRSLSREEVRDVDRRAIERYGLPGIVLMENAGRTAAERLLELGAQGPIVICAGKGNNGGDGFVIARHLDLHNVDVRLLIFCKPDELTGDAAINYRVLQAAGLGGQMASQHSAAQLDAALANADWIVDALLGTGTKGSIREPYVGAIEAINRSGRKVLAIDLPSGLDCDSGIPLGPCVRALHTVTFVARKKGFDTPGASEWTGTVHVAGIGAPRALLEEVFAS